MIKGKPVRRIRLQPLEAGQLWRMADAHLCVQEVGKLLVHYKLGRPDAVRVYYEQNLLHLDEAKAGFSRQAMLKALNAEGVRAKAGQYMQQHKQRIYSEAKWWHHAPVIPTGDLPGCAQLNRTSFHLPLFHEDAPEVIDQYATAFEKVLYHEIREKSLRNCKFTPAPGRAAGSSRGTCRR